MVSVLGCCSYCGRVLKLSKSFSSSVSTGLEWSYGSLVIGE